MATSPADVRAATELPGGPHDVEFFLDPMCPYAWQTSVWLRQVAAQRDLSVGWRFISLRMLNEARDPEPRPAAYLAAHAAGGRMLRVAAALRERAGNAAVGELYRAWGDHLWYSRRDGRPYQEVRAERVGSVDLAGLVGSIGQPPEVAEAADDERWERTIRLETVLALDRAGEDLGTPILTFDPPEGPSYFGPVISRSMSDADALDLYDAVRLVVGLGGFSELKRSKRPPLDLPLVAG